MLILHGKHDLIPSLEARLDMPVLLVHAIRNPFDAIARMSLSAGASLADRTRWYFMHCEAAVALQERMPPDKFLQIYHEDLILKTSEQVIALCQFAGLEVESDHLANVSQKLFRQPSLSRKEVKWSAGDVTGVEHGIARFGFLARYSSSLNTGF